ncbi:putative transposase OrfB [Roseibium album]|uniref:Putative transposase OrfB n=1 Tax=Roseibium album TaxID=311410 RepID=A0A0M7AWM4_9HYPH|nr:putative transposase OrfB [Roseibium album]CTQ79027.1 putative transposase OrfB [Roseibium album]CTQ80484.1 putative transposase OrfB [Roseibium album]
MDANLKHNIAFARLSEIEPAEIAAHMSDPRVAEHMPLLTFAWDDAAVRKFVAQAVRDWINAVGAKTAYIEPGSPWENGYCESFNARFRDELLDGETFYSLKEAQILIEQWRKHYNTKRPHSALGYRPPAPETIIQMDRSPVMH